MLFRSNAFRQAGILYDMVKDLLQGIDPSLQSFKLNRDQAWNLLQGKKSYIRCLASTADKLDALNTSLAIIDEYSNADSSAVKDVLESSMGTRREPLTVVITTNSTKRNTPFQEMLESYKRILRGEIENDELFGHLFTMDEGDREDDPQVWKKVNPHIGVTVQPDYYASSYNKALLTSSGIVEFRTKQLNMLSDKEDAEQWISFSAIKSVIKKVEINPENPFCHIGIDLSSNNDLSAVDRKSVV